MQRPDDAGAPPASTPAATAAARSPSVQRPSLLAPLRSRDFRIVWMGSAVSMLGDQFQSVALAVLTMSITERTSGWGSLLMVQSVPRTLLILFGGLAIDRYSPRAVMMVANVLQAIVVATVAALTFLGAIQYWHLIAYAIAFGTLIAFSIPASMSLVPSIVPASEIRPANALVQMTTNLTLFVGPALAGVVVALAGSAPGIAFNAASFLFSAVCVSRLRIPRGSGGGAPALSQLRAGIDAARRDPVVLTVIVLATVFFFGFAGAAFVGVPALAKLALGADSRGIGLLIGASGAGGLVGAITAGTVRAIRRPALVGSLAIIGNGLLLAVSGFAPSLWVAAIPLFLSGVFGSSAGILFVTLVQTRAPAETRGRVLSLLSLGQFGMYPLSYGMAALVGDVVGPRGVLFVGGSVVTLAGVIGLTRRAFWRIDS